MGKKKRKRYELTLPKGIRREWVKCVLLPRECWMGLAEQDDDGIVVGFRQITIDGIRYLMCGYVERPSLVIDFKGKWPPTA